MNIEISRANVTDARELALVTTSAFKNDTLDKAVTRHATSTASEFGEFLEWRVRNISSQLKQANLHWFKAVDIEANKIVGYGVIVEPEVNGNAPPHEAENQISRHENPLPAFLDTDVLGVIEQKMESAKKETFSDGDELWEVATLAVHPEYQNQGLGSKLLSPMMVLAKGQNQNVFLVSTPAGTRLYEKAGFEKLKEFDVLEGKYLYTLMLLKVKSTAEGSA